MSARLNQLIVLALVILGMTGCTRLGLFDTFVPKDSGAGTIERGIAYGPAPRQKLDIYRPAAPSGRAPVLVFVYGGSWDNGRRQDYSFVGRAFAARGFLTVIADYRLVPDIRYPVFVEDTAKAVAWTYRNASAYGGDPGKLYVAGHSAGAYNVMMTALDPRFLRVEGLSTGIIDAAAGLSGPYDFLPLDVDATRAAFKGVGNLPATQPIYWAKRAGRHPPSFLATGDEDELVKPRNTRALAAALRSSGSMVTEKIYPGLDHPGTLLAISRPLRDRATTLDDIVDFFRQH